jgi:hypothetical protein
MSQHDDRHPWVAAVVHMWDMSVKDDETLVRVTRLLAAVSVPVLSVALALGAVVALATELRTVGWMVTSGAGVAAVATGARVVSARRDMQRQRQKQPLPPADSQPGPD